MGKKGFIEEYSKWIVRVLVVMGMGLIIRLWAVGLYISESCSGGYISLCIGWDLDYYWISASTIALIFFIASIFLIKKIKQTKNDDLKVKLSLIIFVFGIIGTPIFYTISPDFKFYLQKAEYKNSKNEIINIDKYLELTNKYCKNTPDDDFDFKYSREGMCSGKFETKFETIKEYIKILDFANENDFRYLYQLVFRRIEENVGLENMIEKYNDDTFYAYIIYKRGLNDSTKEILRENIGNEETVELLVIYQNSSNEISLLLKEDNLYNIDKFWEVYDKNIREKIKQIPEINQNIF